MFVLHNVTELRMCVRERYERGVQTSKVKYRRCTVCRKKSATGRNNNDITVLKIGYRISLVTLKQMIYITKLGLK